MDLKNFVDVQKSSIVATCDEAEICGGGGLVHSHFHIFIPNQAVTDNISRVKIHCEIFSLLL